MSSRFVFEPVAVKYLDTPNHRILNFACNFDDLSGACDGSEQL